MTELTNTSEDNNRLPIVLIHGLHQTHWIMKPMARQFKKAGYTTYTFDYSSLIESIERHSERLNDWLIDTVKADKFHMVGHSLGGLVIRDFLHRYPDWQENDRIGQIVTLGTPHLGSTTADYVKRLLPVAIGKAYTGALDGKIAELDDNICLGVIAGNKSQGLGKPLLSYHNRTNQLNDDEKTHDGTVYLFETMLPNATDHIILPVTHTGMLVDKTVTQQALFFLENKRFNHDKTTDTKTDKTTDTTTKIQKTNTLKTKP